MISKDLQEKKKKSLGRDFQGKKLFLSRLNTGQPGNRSIADTLFIGYSEVRTKSTAGGSCQAELPREDFEIKWGA